MRGVTKKNTCIKLSAYVAWSCNPASWRWGGSGTGEALVSDFTLPPKRN